MNERTIAFFPVAVQHREFKTKGLSYEDDSGGNAVAGLVTLGRVEIRYHAAYSENRIRDLWSRVQAMPEFAGVDLGTLYYRGRRIA